MSEKTSTDVIRDSLASPALFLISSPGTAPLPLNALATLIVVSRLVAVRPLRLLTCWRSTCLCQMSRVYAAHPYTPTHLSLGCLRLPLSPNFAACLDSKYVGGLKSVRAGRGQEEARTDRDDNGDGPNATRTCANHLCGGPLTAKEY